MTPGIAVGHRHLTVVIAPVALAPVACVVGNAGVRDGSGEDIRLRLQVHGHESAVAGTHAAHLLRIDKRMLGTDTLHALDDILRRTASRRVHMTRAPLLTEARGTAGLKDIGHIAERGPVMTGVDAVEIAAHGRTTTIVIHDHRVFLRSIEVLRQIHPAVDRLALRVHIVPVLAVGHGDVIHDTPAVIQPHLLHRGLTLGGVGREGRGIFGNTVADITDDVRVCRHIHPRHIVAGMLQLHNLTIIRIHLIEPYEVAVLSGEIHEPVAPRPVDGLHRGVEVARQRLNLFRGDIIEIELIVIHIRRYISRQRATDTVEGLRRAFEKDLPAIGRERGVGEESRRGEERVGLEGLCIHHHHVHHLRGTLCQPRVRLRHKQLPSVLRDIHQHRLLVAEGDTTRQSRSHIVACEIVAVAPARLTVVHL